MLDFARKSHEMNPISNNRDRALGILSKVAGLTAYQIRNRFFGSAIDRFFLRLITIVYSSTPVIKWDDITVIIFVKLFKGPSKSALRRSHSLLTLLVVYIDPGSQIPLAKIHSNRW